MRALTVHQPWAWGLVSGLKAIENRSWPTRHRGPLVIHAGRSLASLAEGRAAMPEAPPDEELAFGALIGVVELIDCVPLSRRQGERFAEGPWCWIVDEPRPIVPIPYRGGQKLWEVPPWVVRAFLGKGVR